jgi:hypothetical protein
MGLAEVQVALARLYTDAAWREQFFAGPLRVGCAAGLTPEEATQLARMRAADVNFFALTLHSKRLHEIHKLLPLSRRALGPGCDDSFRAYAETYQPDGPKKHRDDALMFARYLAANLPPDAPAYAPDVLRYETTQLLAGQPARFFRVCRFRYALKPLLHSLAMPDASPQAIPGRHLAVWLRLTPNAPLRHWIR